MGRGICKLDITDVKIRMIRKEGKMKGIASITLDNEFVVHDIKIFEGDKGLFIAMPSRKVLKYGEYKDIAHPINSATREKVQTSVIDKYKLINMKYEDKKQLASSLQIV